MCPCWAKRCGACALLARTACDFLQELVHVFEPETAAQHEHLQPVQQLRDLLGQRVVGLVFGGEPHLACLFEDLLALRVDARLERGDRGRTCRARCGLLAQLREQLVEGLHASSPLTLPVCWVASERTDRVRFPAAPGIEGAPRGSPATERSPRASRAEHPGRPTVSRGALPSRLRVAGLQLVAGEPDE